MALGMALDGGALFIWCWTVSNQRTFHGVAVSFRAWDMWCVFCIWIFLFLGEKCRILSEKRTICAVFDGFGDVLLRTCGGIANGIFSVCRGRDDV